MRRSMRGFKLIPSLLPLLGVSTLTAQILPAGSGAFAPTGGFVLCFQVSEQGANPFAADTGTGVFDVGETEFARLPADGVEDDFRL